MSARQPFLFSARPSSRAASRAAHRKQAPDQNLEAPHFGPPPLEPQNLKTSNLRKQKRNSRGSIESMLPPRSDVVARAAPRHSSPLAQSNVNVNTEEILIHSQNMSAPHLSLPASMVSTPFKVPDVPASRAASSLIPESTHMAIECPVPVFPMAASADGDFTSGGTPSAHQLQISTKNATENGIDGVGDSSDDRPVQHLDKTNPLIEMPFGRDGPRRMILDREGETDRLLRKAKRSLNLSVEGGHPDDDDGEYVRTRKKSKDEYHGQNTHDHAHLEQQLQHQQYSALESMSHYRHTSQGHVPTAPHLDDQQHWQSQQARQAPRSTPKRGGLWFLSQDIESFIVKHREEYDALTQRWSHCTIEEWYEGEKEHMSDLTEFMEIVKNHMINKLGLLGQIESHIAEHKDALSGRVNVLSNAGNALVERSGAAVAINSEDDAIM